MQIVQLADARLAHAAISFTQRNSVFQLGRLIAALFHSYFLPGKQPQFRYPQ
jgi:hypothetical protein